MRLGSAVLAVLVCLSLTGCGLVGVRDLDDVLRGTDPFEPAETLPPDIELATPLVPPPHTTPPVRQGPLPGWTVGPDDVVLRIGIHDGYDRSEQIRIDSHGRVVRIGDTSVMTTVDDYTTWRLTRTGLRRVLRAVDRTGVHAARPGDLGDGAVSPYSRTVTFGFGDGTGVAASIAPEEAGIPERERIWRLAQHIASPRWHRPHLAEGPRPWAPPALGILAGPPDRTGRSPLSPRDPFRPWPLERGIRELSQGMQPNAYGEPRQALCLRGADAAKVFALFTGENTAYLRVDDGERWELNVTVHLPDYDPYRSPCSPGPRPRVTVEPLPVPTVPPRR